MTVAHYSSSVTFCSRCYFCFVVSITSVDDTKGFDPYSFTITRALVVVFLLMRIFFVFYAAGSLPASCDEML